MTVVITLTSREASLKRRIRAHLRDLGFARGADGLLLPPNLEKETYRSVHSHQRAEKLEKNRKWLERKSRQLLPYFASGNEVDPVRIKPRIELTKKDSLGADLFRFAGLYWRIPISEGYGRRLRFLVWDDNNGKLIGLLALGDAVFNLKVRDDLIGWDHHRRVDALVHLMDAYVLGAVPPYNALLGGKLIASLARSLEVVQHFDERYRNSIGLISKKKKSARLVAITTSSALGRSSIYNRLKLSNELIFRPIGYTSGWGHFHIPDEIFDDLRKYLEFKNHKYANGNRFGEGPNWRIRAIRHALGLLGLDPDLIRHGLPREVFFCEVAYNAIPFLLGEHRQARYHPLQTVSEIGELVKHRWMVPRSHRDESFLAWRAENILTEITNQEVGARARSYGLGAR